MLLPFSLPLKPLLNRMEEVEAIVTKAHHNTIKIHLLKIEANTKIKIATQQVEGIGVEEEEEVLHQVEEKLLHLQESLRVGIDFASGVETLLPLMKPIIPSNNALITRKLEKNGGNINSKHLPLNLLSTLHNTLPLRETSKESI